MAWQSSTINPATTSPATDISKVLNDLAQLKGVIGGTPDAAIPSVWTTPAAVLAQTANSGTTGGTSTAYTLTPAQSIAAYAAGQTFWVTFHTASGASPTLAISGLTSPPNLVKQLADGSYTNVAANDIPANHRSRVTLLSTTQALVEDMPTQPASGGSSLVLLSQQTISSAVAAVDFTSGIGSTYDRYILEIADLVSATDAVNLLLRVSEDGGSTFKAGATDYAYAFSTNNTGASTPAGSVSSGTTAILLASSVSNAKPLDATVRVGAPSGTSRHKIFTYQVGAEISGGSFAQLTGAGAYQLSNNAINALRILASSGNIAAGRFALYGVKKQ